jgi:hypothetical protein
MALWAIPGSIPQAQLSEHLCIDANNTVILLDELEDEVLARLSEEERRTLHDLLAKALGEDASAPATPVAPGRKQ